MASRSRFVVTGLILFVCGSAFAWIFDAPMTLVDAWMHPDDEAPVVVELVSSTPTGAKENKVVVFEHAVRLPDGSLAHVYSTGPLPVAPGPVTATASASTPRHVHVEGTRLHPFSVAVGLVLAVPLAGLAAVLVALVRGARRPTSTSRS